MCVRLPSFEPEPPDDRASGYGQFLTAPERETIVGLNDGEDTATIYSAQRVIINRLRKHPAAELIEEGTFRHLGVGKVHDPVRVRYLQPC